VNFWARGRKKERLYFTRAQGEKEGNFYHHIGLDARKKRLKSSCRRKEKWRILYISIKINPDSHTNGKAFPDRSRKKMGERNPSPLRKKGV